MNTSRQVEQRKSIKGSLSAAHCNGACLSIHQTKLNKPPLQLLRLSFRHAFTIGIRKTTPEMSRSPVWLPSSRHYYHVHDSRTGATKCSAPATIIRDIATALCSFLSRYSLAAHTKTPMLIKVIGAPIMAIYSYPTYP